MATAAGAFGYLSQVNKEPPLRPSPRPDLHIPAAALDLGVVWADQNFVYRLPIHNAGKNDVRLSRLLSSCNCSRAQAQTPTMIGAGQTVAVEMPLDLLRGAPNDLPTEWPYELRLAPRVEIETQGRWRAAPTPQWVLKGKVRRFYSLSESVVNFPADLVHGREYPMHTVLVYCAHPIKSLLSRSMEESGQPSTSTRRPLRSALFP